MTEESNNVLTPEVILGMLRHPVEGHWEPQRFAILIGLRWDEYLQLAGVSNATVRKAPGSEEVQTFIGLAIEVIRAFLKRGNTLPEAIKQSRSTFYSAPFGNKSCLQIVSEGRFLELMGYLGLWADADLPPFSASKINLSIETELEK
ncbi:hypothetical protein ACYPKM_05315 [Pseudomonas aeruginosa]